jgi:hypothetical protein
MVLLANKCANVTLGLMGNYANLQRPVGQMPVVAVVFANTENASVIQGLAASNVKRSNRAQQNALSTVSAALDSAFAMKVSKALRVPMPNNAQVRTNSPAVATALVMLVNACVTMPTKVQTAAL